MNPNEIYKKVASCLVEDMDGELLVFNPNNTVTLHLNGPSSIVWELCSGENTVDEMINTLREAFPDQADQIAKDVAVVIADLKHNEVIELVKA